LRGADRGAERAETADAQQLKLAQRGLAERDLVGDD
jgi:hypothetical protein